MFAKPYRLKSNNTLKNTEKKHLVQRIQNAFPSVPETKIKELVPNKSNTSCMKLILHSDETVGVFVVDGVPVMIDVDDYLVPTLCALWKLPELVPTLIIHTEVLPKLQGGAPLYAPGVTVPARNSGTFLPTFKPGGIIACCTVDNAAAAAVGKSLMSSGDLIFRQGGVLMETLHILSDQLCKDVKFNRITRPKLSLPKYEGATDITTDLKQLSIQPAFLKEEWPSLGAKVAPPAVVAPPVPNQPRLIDADQHNNNPDTGPTLDANELNDISTEQDGIPTDMDGLLRWCLLSFIKLDGKNVQLPLKTNLLYKNYLMPLCPEGQTLDVKKSTYKKMSKFMDAMQQEGLLEVRELERGVDAVVVLQLQHEALRGHRARRPPRPEGGAAPGAGAAAGGGARGEAPPHIRELLCVTAAVLDILAPHKKGTALTSADVRACVSQYVTTHQLTSTNTSTSTSTSSVPNYRSSTPRGQLRIDNTLAKLTGRNIGELIKWEDLMNAVHNKMTASTELRLADGATTLLRSRLQPVTMNVATRSGNKKVTLVSNLEQFGFSLVRLCSECQGAAAASCTITRSPGARADQLLVQGDQTHMVAKLLIEKYGLPKKYLEGADKALNKKK